MSPSTGPRCRSSSAPTTRPRPSASASSTCSRLDYPGLEVVVVDDGSTDTTGAIAAEWAARDPRIRALPIPHGGLSVARNAGAEAARGEIVAYLDADAYPTPEWPYYLALGMDGPTVGGVGGPNLPPPDDGLGAQRVARAPGGPVHVLTADDRAEHVPGCNMAFWKIVLDEVGGFDPVYTAAGDDVDLCWKVLDRGWEIGFHPAALVWHHRRGSARAYLRQQRGYGRAESLVQQRHPDRFTPLGTARWRGRIYDSLTPALVRPRVYRGLYGAAAYQSIYADDGHAVDVAHQAGVPLAVLGLLATPLALLGVWFAVLPAAALALLGVLAVVDVVRVRPPRSLPAPAARFRLAVAFLHLAQPVVRTWGRLREDVLTRRSAPASAGLPGPVRRLARGVLLLPLDRPRAQLAADLVADLRRSGLRVVVPSGWEDHDARLLASGLLAGDIVTSAHPEGCVQMRVRRRARRGRGVLAAAALAVAGWLGPVYLAVLAAAVAVDVAVGWARIGRRVRAVVRGAAP